jgi:hypothetical protein
LSSSIVAPEKDAWGRITLVILIVKM